MCAVFLSIRRMLVVYDRLYTRHIRHRYALSSTARRRAHSCVIPQSSMSYKFITAHKLVYYVTRSVIIKWLNDMLVNDEHWNTKLSALYPPYTIRIATTIRFCAK